MCEKLEEVELRKDEEAPFGVPMVWREGKDYVTDCYLCMTNLQGLF